MEWRGHNIKVAVLYHFDVHLEGLVGLYHYFLLCDFTKARFLEDKLISPGFSSSKL